MDDSQIYNSRLFELLDVFEKKKLKQLEEWLACPVHNKSKEVLKLYRGLMRHYGSFDQPITKSTLMKYMELPPESEESVHRKHEGTLRLTAFKLTEQVRKFLCWQYINDNKLLEKQLLMDTLIKKKLYNHLPSIIAKLKKQLNDSPHRTFDYYKYMVYLNKEEFGIELILNNRNAHEKMQGLLDIVRQSSLSKILKFYCSAKNIEKIRKVEYDYPFMEYVEAYIRDSADKDIPIIKVYFTLLKLLDEQKPEHYNELKNYLFANIEVFDLREIRQFFNHMTNYCNWKIEEGDTHFFKENHDIHQKGLELGCWTASVYFSAQQFIRFITNALTIGETKWVDEFIATYEEQLHPDLKDDTLHYCHALVAFYDGRYKDVEEAARNFLTQKQEDFIEHLKWRVLLVKIYYELNKNDLYIIEGFIDDELKAIGKYVSSKRNKKMSESLRLAYKNFVDALKKILRRKSKILEGRTVSQKNIKKLQTEIADTSPLIERTWLKEKIEELIQEIK